MIEVENKIRIYETDGGETPAHIYQTISIKNHGTTRTFIILGIPGTAEQHALEITVSAEDLKHAIDNATNTN